MQLLGEIARKHGDPAALALEAEKTSLAAAIGAETGLFRVPAVVDFDAANGVLDTVQIKGLTTFVELISARRTDLPELFERVGIALGAVHARLILPPHLKTPLTYSPDGSGVGDDVFVHGDFNGANVCYDSRSDEIV